MKILHSIYQRPAKSGRLLTLLGVTALTCFVGRLQAEISVGATGAGPLAFDSAPTIAQFSTSTNNGNATVVFDVASMDAAVQTRSAASINSPLPTSGTTPPSASALGFRYNTSLRLMQTRPTTGTAPNDCSVTFLSTTLRNDSGQNRPVIVVAYDYGVLDFLAGELPGLHAYYSLTGEPGSWQPIPELTGSETAGKVSGTINLGTWAPGSALYLLWADDNANSITDPTYTIDNFQVLFGIDPPLITQQPVNATNIEGRRITLSVQATGLGLQYQWHKLGVGPIDPTGNPTATQSTFVITNAVLDDTGDYFVFVANGAAGVMSQNAHLEVLRDQAAPAFLSASVLPNVPNTLRLVLDEPLCLTCGDPASFFNWSVSRADNGMVMELTSITITGTNIDFGVALPSESGVAYRITMTAGDGGIEDLYNNSVAPDTFIDTFPTANFVQNGNSYTGTTDTELRGAAPDSPQGTAIGVTVDQEDGGAVSHGLLRFSNIFGSAPGQVPVGVEIVSATLRLNHNVANANGSPVELHRMLVDWDPATATFNSFVNGVQADGSEAAAAIDATIVSSTLTVPFSIEVNVTPTVQAWANGLDNYGWAFICTGTDGYRWDTSESTAPPSLAIVYRVVPCAAIAITQQPTAPPSAQEGATFALSVSVSSPGCPPQFQWTKDGIDIPGANDSSYTVQNAVPGTSVYRVRVSNSFPSSATSDAASVTVVPDTARPRVTRVVSSNSTTVAITFSKVLSAASAQSLANYSILGTPAVTVTGATLGANGNTVTLTTSPRAFPGEYTLRVQGVTDNRQSANLVDPNPTLVALTGVSVIDGWNTAWQFSTNNQDATLSGTPWYSPAFVPGADWSTGNGLFGFEDTAATIALLPSPIATPLPPNNIAATPDLLVAAYFRKAITLPALPAGARYVMCAVIDDGAIFYLDGQPILTNNMLNLPPYTFTNRAAGAAAEGVIQVLPLNATPGDHTLAVEVHQTGTTSSDVVFGLDIRMISTAAPALTITSGASTNTVSWSADSSWDLTGSANVAGPYAAEAGANTGSPFRFAAPTTATNHFYRLQYNGRP